MTQSEPTEGRFSVHSEIEPGSGPRLRLEDALASGRRLWLRGRLVDPDAAPLTSVRSWWRPWRSTPETPDLSIRVETQVAGQSLAAETGIGSDGRFEVLFDCDLPPARRGWRVARHRVELEGKEVAGCNLVLTPPEGAAGAVLVVLPLEATRIAESTRAFCDQESAHRLTPLLNALQDSDLRFAICDFGLKEKPGVASFPCKSQITNRKSQIDARGSRPFYYLAAVDPENGPTQAELALAVTALGWPSGHVVALNAGRVLAPDALVRGVDRLRWVFSGALPLRVLNLEPLFRPDVADAGDRSPVERYAGEQDAETLLDSGKGLPRRAPEICRPLRSAGVPRHPLVFCHGMLAMSLLRMHLPEEGNYFACLRGFLRERGIRAFFPSVAGTAGVATRAAQLRELISDWTDEPVNLIGHSMGGLDARYLITRLGMADRVKSLTTIATPHRGSPVADWAKSHYRDRVPLLLTLEAIGVNVDGFRDCQTDSCVRFNEEVPDQPGVRYFSHGAAVPLSRVTPPLRRAWNIVSATEGPNDGLVSVQSAVWGEYLGTLTVDHFAQTPDGLFVRPGESFDSVGFFARLIEDLARRGL
jgi:triacylglycerol lipase